MAGQHKAGTPVPRDMPDPQRDDDDTPTKDASGETAEAAPPDAGRADSDGEETHQQMGVPSDQPAPEEPTD